MDDASAAACAARDVARRFASAGFPQAAAPAARNPETEEFVGDRRLRGLLEDWDGFRPGRGPTVVDWVANKKLEISNFNFKFPRARNIEIIRYYRQVLQGSFSVVSKPNFASKHSLESSRRDLHNALLCTVLDRSLISIFSLKNASFC